MYTEFAKKKVFEQLTLKAGTHQPNRWTSEMLERLRRGRQLICSVCSAASEAFGAAQTLSDPIQHAKSEEVGCWPSEPLDTQIGGVLANQRGVSEGRNTVCALVFYALRSVISCFHVLEYWHETNCYSVRSGLINLCSFGNALMHV